MRSLVDDELMEPQKGGGLMRERLGERRGQMMVLMISRRMAWPLGSHSDLAWLLLAHHFHGS
jgi:hypothetical protein